MIENNTQIILVAGGGGTRLWPISTSSKPKQFINIIDDSSLLQKTFEIISSSLDKDSIWISTNSKYLNTILEQIPNINQGNIILEPSKRDSFAAVSTAAAVVASKVGEETPMIFIPCDDHLKNEESVKNFLESQSKISKLVRDNTYSLVIAGIKPDSPNTNYGYIEIESEDNSKVFTAGAKVKSFREKPNLETAEKFLKNGNYLWNKFNFAFNYKEYKKILNKIDPKSLKIVEDIKNNGLTDQKFCDLPKIAFDFHVLEKMDKDLGVVGMDIEWDDLGSWEVISKTLPAIDSNSTHTEISASGNKTHLDTDDIEISFVGVSDLIVVKKDNQILILNPKNSSDIKKLVERKSG